MQSLKKKHHQHTHLINEVLPKKESEIKWKYGSIQGIMSTRNGNYKDKYIIFLYCLNFLKDNHLKNTNHNVF